MDKLTKLFFTVFLLAIQLNIYSQSQSGFVKEGLIIHSEILNKDVRYTIYLPFDYESSSRYYPAVYLLHGYTDNDMGWIQFGEANMIADDAISAKEIPSMVLVMPDAGVSWYINNYDNSVRYEDFFIKEFIPYIEKNYRIRSEKRFRGAAGLSMGGYGALIYALKYTDMFAACAAYSTALYTEDEVVNMSDERWAEVESILYGSGLKGKDRLTPHLMENDLFHIVKTGDIEKFKSVRMYIDCGDDDFLYKGNSEFHILLRDMKIPHEYRVRNGGHQWSYWRSGLLDGLKFIGESFHQQ